MKNIFRFALVGLALLVGGFLGFRVGLNQSELTKSKAYEALIMADTSAKLRVFMEISEKIQAGEYSGAKCKADLIASVLFDEVNKCIKNDSCRTQLSDVFQEQIPSILADGKLKFKYYEDNEVCEGL